MRYRWSVVDRSETPELWILLIPNVFHHQIVQRRPIPQMAERIARQPRIFAGMERQGGKSAETGALPRSQPATVPDEPQSERVRIMQNFSVSCLSASLAHFPHHPLYTLKTQMMNKGKIFHFGSFCRTALESRGAFLMRGI